MRYQQEGRYRGREKKGGRGRFRVVVARVEERDGHNKKSNLDNSIKNIRTVCAWISASIDNCENGEFDPRRVPQYCSSFQDETTSCARTRVCVQEGAEKFSALPRTGFPSSSKYKSMDKLKDSPKITSLRVYTLLPV